MESRLARAPRIRFRNVAGETIVLDQENRKILVLNEVGGRLLELLDGVATIRQHCTMISSEFDVTEDQTHRDVTAFARSLVERGIAIEVRR